MDELKKKSKAKPIIIGIAVLLVFAALFVLLLSMYQTEKEKYTIQLMPNAESQPGYLEINMKGVSIDPVKGELGVRLQFDAKGDLADENGMLAKDLTLDYNSATGKSQATFKAGERMNAVDATFELIGDINAYPFDSHVAFPEMALNSTVKDANGEITSYEGIPMTVYYSSALAGYTVSAAEAQYTENGDIQVVDSSPGNDGGYALMAVGIERSPSAITFAIFIMVLQWLLALSAVGVIVMWIRGRKIEVTMFGWLGALLFALVPLRNAMPAAPPIGALSDIISFFWAEIIVAVCLVAGVVTWLKRGSVDGKVK